MTLLNEPVASQPSRRPQREELRRRDCLAALGAAVIAVACEEDAADSEPDRLVAELIARLQRVHGDRKAARAAYDLLWSDARRNLAERAKRASDVAGREIAPEEMLPPSRFALHRKPRHYDVRVDGDWAEVSITSDGGVVDRVKCVREDGKWRVVLELPPLPPIEKRAEGAL